MTREREAMTLSYSNKALEPVMSSETVDTHFGIHYKTYLKNYNDLIVHHPEFSESSIVDIIQHSDGPLFNNAAQMVNHELLFGQFKQYSDAENSPKGVLLDAINTHFENFEEMCKLMTTRAATLFGSGWVWLALDDKNLVVVNGSNAYTPLTENMKPLMAIDVWEHAYYIDYRQKRAEYLENFWKIVDWHIIEERFVQAVKDSDYEIDESDM